MKYVLIVSMLLFPFTAAFAQSGLNTEEPAAELLGAPHYPGSVFIRMVTGNDPYFVTAEYATGDDVEVVLAYFERKLPEKREFEFQDKKIYMFGLLMNTWSKFPGKPKRDDLHFLESEPNIRFLAIEGTDYESLITFFARKPEMMGKAQALENARTMIRYTYRIQEVNPSGVRILGRWRNTDRDLPKWYGSILEFRKEGIYTITLTPDNLRAIGKSDSTARRETGAYSILATVITFKTDSPAIGDAKKSGIATVGRASLSLELVNMPRLSFIRIRK
jgi:hypothetical protein